MVISAKTVDWKFYLPIFPSSSAVLIGQGSATFPMRARPLGFLSCVQCAWSQFLGATTAFHNRVNCGCFQFCKVPKMSIFHVGPKTWSNGIFGLHQLRFRQVAEFSIKVFSNSKQHFSNSWSFTGSCLQYLWIWFCSSFSPRSSFFCYNFKFLQEFSNSHFLLKNHDFLPRTHSYSNIHSSASEE